MGFPLPQSVLIAAGAPVVADLSAQADGATMLFALPSAAIASSLSVYRRGLALAEGSLPAGDYVTVNATTIQFHLAPQAGDNVLAVYTRAA